MPDARRRSACDTPPSNGEKIVSPSLKVWLQLLGLLAAVFIFGAVILLLRRQLG